MTTNPIRPCACAALLALSACIVPPALFERASWSSPDDWQERGRYRQAPGSAEGSGETQPDAAPAAPRTAITCTDPLREDAAPVERLIERLAGWYDAAPQQSPERLYPAFLEALGFDPPSFELTERDLAAAVTTAREPRPWEAEVPVDRLANAPFPTLIARGVWDVAPTGARKIAAVGLHAICDVLVARLGAESAAFPGTMHNPQLLGTPFNKRLREFLRSARPQARSSSFATCALN